MSTVKKMWSNEPDWLQKKRQLAQALGGRFPKIDQQEKWLPWQTAPSQTTGWLDHQGNYAAQPLATAVNTYSELLQENLMEKAVRWQDNQLFAAHLSRIDAGQFIYVPDNCQLPAPIRLAPQGIAANPHNVIIVGANSQVTIEETMRLKSAQPLFAATELLLGAGARVVYRRADELRAPAIYSAVHAYQARGAQLLTRMVVANEGDVTLSLANFLDGAASTWDSSVLLQPGRYGRQAFHPVVDGYGAGSHASLTTYIDQLTSDQVKHDQFQTGSGEPLPVTEKTILKAKQGAGWQSADPWLNRYFDYAQVTNGDY